MYGGLGVYMSDISRTRASATHASMKRQGSGISASNSESIDSEGAISLELVRAFSLSIISGETNVCVVKMTAILNELTMDSEYLNHGVSIKTKDDEYPAKCPKKPW